jgi:hypothetical protein
MRNADKIYSTKYCGIIVAGVAFFSIVGAASDAQSGTTGNGWTQPSAPVSAPPAADNYDHDLSVAKYCQERPTRMNSIPCKDVKARHPEMFAAAPPKTTAP